jgi:hypothetical protein
MVTRILLVLWFAALPRQMSALEFVLVDPAQPALTAAIEKVQGEKFSAVIFPLDETTPLNAAVHAANKAGLDVYYWIEVGRNQAMAKAHPEWMGSIGMHDDWLKRFSNTKPPEKGKVAKAYPWVPITGRQPFNAHLGRIKALLSTAPADYRGLILNDLQGPPSSCGCGNLQCRWAADYQVAPTTEQLSTDDAAAKFVAAVRKLAPGKTIVPVWTTECEHQDLPPKHQQGKPGTGLCGTVGCAIGACPKEFTTQWTKLTQEHSGPIALLATHQALERPNPDWIPQSLSYLETTVPARFPRTNLWMVVQGKNEKEERAAREIAARLGIGATVVARVKIDQSYSPRVIAAK